MCRVDFRTEMKLSVASAPQSAGEGGEIAPQFLRIKV